ncbi:MAG: hypothetical protein JSW11_03725 [Candidatus Heimdallarchaeota archaeon]|nr:MAG: hypothetical protein JSW11_03725 [Candidatus Heimdallarchaeota archaeon]
MSTDSVLTKLLEQARNELYSWATNDLTCQLAKEVMSIGLAKIKLFYQELGLDPRVIIVFGPDGSVTRNKARFNEGVGYGCVVATKDYIFPSLLHPNGCGFGLFQITDMPSLHELMKRLNNLKKDGVPIGEQRGKWDVWKSNHFIDILRLDKISQNYFQYEEWLSHGSYVLIHSSQQIETNRLSHWDSEKFTTVDTPFGTIEGLCDEALIEYLSFFQKVEEYSKRKRIAIANELFGEDNVRCITNPTHQGYYKENKYNVMRLGLYNSLNKTGERNVPLFPLAFNGYSFIYLYEGQPNLKKKYWTNNQHQRAKNMAHDDFLKQANILPHGGGYKLMYPFSRVRPVVFDKNNYFELLDAPMESRMIIQNIEALEYGYRGPTEILPLVDRLELGKRVARFVPVQVIKF